MTATSKALILTTKFLRKKNILLILISFLFVSLPFSFLFSPPPRSQDSICGMYVHITENTGFTLNCDSGALVNLALNPKSVLGKGELLQSRPGIIPVGILFAIPFIVVSNIINIPEYIAETGINLNYFLGFVLFNFVLLLSGVFLFIKIGISQNFSKLLILAGSLGLVTNFVVKAFIFTPHQQIFNVVLPIILIYIIVKGIEKDFSNKTIFFVSVITGLFCLFYPSFVLIPAALGIIFVHNRINLKRLNIFKFIPLLIALIISLFPTLIWPILVRVRTGNYFNLASDGYRQFVWIFDAFKEGLSPGVHAITLHFNDFLRSISLEFIVSFVLIIVLLFGVLFLKKEKRVVITKNLSLYFILLGIVAIFYFLLGSYFERLTYNILLIIQFIIILIFSRYLKIFTQFKRLDLVVLVFVIVKFVVLLVQNGPYTI